MKAKKDKKGAMVEEQCIRPVEGKADNSESRRHLSFVIALWLEPREQPGEPEWRWRVVEVKTGKEAYFNRIKDLLAYVSHIAGVSPPL